MSTNVIASDHRSANPNADRIVNQIDHVVINNKGRRSLKDVHTCRGADAGSDHYLVVSRLKLCLRKAPIKHD